MQVVILAGGQGTRIHHLFPGVPKAMVLVHGKPFLHHQLDLLHDSGIRRVLLCLGVGASQITSYVGDGSRFGMEIAHSVEDRPLGTAGALLNAKSMLEETFLVTYGDAYLMLDYAQIISAFTSCGTSGLLVVYRNEGRYDRSNTAVTGDRVTAYNKSDPSPSMAYIDEGVSVFSRSALDLVPTDRPCDLGYLFEALIKKNELAAYQTSQRFYEIGAPEGLQEFTRLMATRDRRH